MGFETLFDRDGGPKTPLTGGRSRLLESAEKSGSSPKNGLPDQMKRGR